MDSSVKFLKCLKDVSLPNPKGKDFAPLVIWTKGKYYKILHESDKYICPMNNLLITTENNDNTGTIENLILLEKPNKNRTPLNFIVLTKEEVTQEQDMDKKQ